MDEKTFEISLYKNPRIKMQATEGHFSTNLHHTNYYLDVSTLKSNARLAKEVAKELAVPYISSAIVETIVCMENTKVIGAFLAQELLQEGTAVMNSGGEINVVTPINSTDGKLIFYDNELEWIEDRHIILLTAQVISGRILTNAMECISYYKGLIDGISTLFLYPEVLTHLKINTIFTPDDIEGYSVFTTGECEMCKSGCKLDAIISSDGYMKI